MTVIPMKLQVATGGGDPQLVGAWWADMLRDVCGLTPGSALLEIGSGAGRLPLALQGWLSGKGRYQGIDVWREAVDWCAANLGRQNVHFTWADVENGCYHPTGTIRAEDYRFPYPDSSFDVVAALSVYTHMLLPGVESYLRQAARVLKPEGRFLWTFFLMPPGGQREGEPQFLHPDGDFSWVAQPAEPEAAIAHDMRAVLALHREAGLVVEACWRYGLQDLICGRQR